MIEYVAVKITIGGKAGIIQIFDMLAPDAVKAGVGHLPITPALNITAVW